MPSAHPYLNSAEAVKCLYIKTFGCQMNEYDSLRVQRILHTHGYTVTTDMASADVIFLNTCSVREKPEHKVYSFLGRLRNLKARNPGLKIIVGGCVAQQFGPQLLDRFDHLDIVLGTRGIPTIGELLAKTLSTNERFACLPDEEPALPEDFPSNTAVPSITAPVTIMQGCNNYCTYCIVPYVRGRERSRAADEIIREIQSLVASGCREVVLLGQNVNSYGYGLNPKIRFSDLLYRIAAETDVCRVRFTTSHPKDLTDDLMRCFAELPRLCRHLHLPFQAGSDKILRLMNRGYTASEYLDKISRLRDICPDIGISADVMVGFPGETEKDFMDTMQLVERVEFDNLFSFRYSDRPYAKSSSLPDKVDEATKSRRLTELQSFQAAVTLAKNLKEVGHLREVLVEGAGKASGSQLSGRTSQNRIVNFEGPKELIGEMIYVKIIAGFSHSLKGEL